jgi:hypothetical protein
LVSHRAAVYQVKMVAWHAPLTMKLN